MEQKKRVFYSEAAYVIGIICIQISISLMEKADFGLSMIVAPAYLLYLRISEFLPFFTFGVASYTMQGIVLLLMCLILKRFRISYLFSFVTAVVGGYILDGFLYLLSFYTFDAMWSRIVMFAAGTVICCIGVAFMFRTYIPPESYDLFVKEVSKNFGIRQDRFKQAYDCTSCVVSVIFSFCFFGFGHFEGVKLGTVVCALVNGPMIGLFGRLYDRYFRFERLIIQKN